MIDFLFVIFELFSLSLAVETLLAEVCRSRRFLKGRVSLTANFRRKGASATNHCWCQKFRVIAISCGIKIFAVRCSVLSQSTRAIDRLGGQTDGQNYDCQDRARIAASRGKNNVM